MQYEFIRDTDGIHQIGGTVPPDFKIPANEFKAGFQYLGFINNTDPIFQWLPFKLHLIHPIYCDTYSVYLDYNDPAAPTIIEPLDTAAETTAYDELDANSRVTFEAVPVKAMSGTTISEYKCIGLAGEPEWVQAAEMPLCPKTNRPMRFLCQLSSFGHIKSIDSNITPEKGYERYFEQLNFWGDGNLYIFLEPTSRTMCYTMQNT